MRCWKWVVSRITVALTALIADDPQPSWAREIPQRSSTEVCYSFRSEAREVLNSEPPRVHHAARWHRGVAAGCASAFLPCDGSLHSRDALKPQ